MLRKFDSHHGHLTEDTAAGEVYQDDRSLVKDCPRACKGCNLHISAGSHDPCIAQLPDVLHACCGHGLDKTPRGTPNGYVAFTDGRQMYFSGTLGGTRIREVVDLVLQGHDLPDGFAFAAPGWWTGLSPAQRDWVDEHIPQSLLALVKVHASPSEAFLVGDALWFDGLSDAEKARIWSEIPASIADLVQQSKIAKAG